MPPPSSNSLSTLCIDWADSARQTDDFVIHKYFSSPIYIYFCTQRSASNLTVWYGWPCTSSHAVKKATRLVVRNSRSACNLQVQWHKQQEPLKALLH